MVSAHQKKMNRLIEHLRVVKNLLEYPVSDTEKRTAPTACAINLSRLL